MRLYHPMFEDDVEDIQEYQPGGYHPISIGDEIDGGRYKILHKLGSGGFSTIWLARDTIDMTYRALKILRAGESADSTELRRLKSLQSFHHPTVRFIPGLTGGFWTILGANQAVPPALLQALQRVAPIQADPLKTAHIRGVDRHFLIRGPNGRHNCLVAEVAGPSVKSIHSVSGHGYNAGSRRLRVDIAHRVMRQIVEAVEFLHSHEMCHGDLTLSNVLLAVKPMVDWTEDEVYERLGAPETFKVHPSRNTSLTPSAPPYVVQAAKLVDAKYLTGDALLVDFGQAFPFAQPPEPDAIGIPYSYRAPETMFDSKICSASDVWSLACVLYEIRAGDALFPTFFGGQDEVIEDMVSVKGKLPDRWWSKWDSSSLRLDEDGKWWKDYGDVRTVKLDEPFEQLIAAIGEQDDETAMFGSEVAILEPLHTKVSEDEAVIMKDFLERALKWEPEERMSVAEMLQHPWIAGDFFQTGATNADD